MNMEFNQHIIEYMTHCYSRQLRPKTMHSYESTLRLFERWCKEELGIETVDAVTESTIRHYISDIQQRGKYTFYSNDLTKVTNAPEHRRDYCEAVSTITINNYLRNLRAFFNWLEYECIIKQNPMQRIKLLKSERKAKEYMDDTDFRKLTHSLNKALYPEHRDYAIIMLLMDTGMRLGECSSLLVSDVDMTNLSISLRTEITKGRRNRVVFFSPKTETLLRHWLSFKDRHVESDYRGLTYQYMENYIATHANAASIMEEYKELRLQAKCHSIRYANIKKWFLAMYPEVAQFGVVECAESKVENALSIVKGEAELQAA